MRNKNEVLEEAVISAIDNFANNYVEKMAENWKENYTIEDIRVAFMEGAKWMKDFLDVKQCCLIVI